MEDSGVEIFHRFLRVNKIHICIPAQERVKDEPSSHSPVKFSKKIFLNMLNECLNLFLLGKYDLSRQASSKNDAHWNKSPKYD